MSLPVLRRFGGHYGASATELDAHWALRDATLTRDATGARDGGPCLVPGTFSDLGIVMPALETGYGIVGYAFRTGSSLMNGSNGNFIIQIGDNLLGTGAHTTISLVSAADPRLAIRRGTGDDTIIVAGATPLAVSQHYTIEFKFKIHDTTGEVQVKLNGFNEIHNAGGLITGLDTRNGGSGNHWGNVRWSGVSGADWRMESCWVILPTGDAPTDFLGPQMAWYLPPDGDDAVQFTRNGGATNASRLVDAPHTGDADHNESTTVGHVDFLTLAAVPAFYTGKAIAGVQPHAYFRQTNVGASQVRAGIVTNLGTPVNGPTVIQGQSALYAEIKGLVSSLNPDTGAGFLEAAINGLKVKYEKVA